MEGRSLADDTPPESMAGETSRSPADLTGKKAEPPADKARSEKEKKAKAKADAKAEKAAEAAKSREEEPKREGRLARLRFSKKKDMPGGLWLKCESCSQVIFRKELEEKGRVCPSCGFHFT